MPTSNDTPVKSWEDFGSRTQDLYKIRGRYARTDDPRFERVPFVPLENSIPTDTHHRDSIPQLPAGPEPTPGGIIFSKNPALVGDVVTVTADRGVRSVNTIMIGTVHIPTFTVINDTSLTMTIPTMARTGFVRFNTSFGFVSSPTKLKIAVLPTASSIHFNPIGGVAGSTIAVSADQGLSTVTAISVNGVPVVTINLSTDVSGDKNLSFLIPAGATVGTVQFTNLAGNVTSIDTMTVISLPTAASIHFAPVTGPVGTVVTMSADKGLASVSTIRVHGVLVQTFTLISSTSLTFVIPPGATTGTVQFTNPAGSVTSVDVLTVT